MKEHGFITAFLVSWGRDARPAKGRPAPIAVRIIGPVDADALDRIARKHGIRFPDGEVDLAFPRRDPTGRQLPD